MLLSGDALVVCNSWELSKYDGLASSPVRFVMAWYHMMGFAERRKHKNHLGPSNLPLSSSANKIYVIPSVQNLGDSISVPEVFTGTKTKN